MGTQISGTPEKMRMLKSILLRVNEEMPACWCANTKLLWEREENPEGRAKFDFVEVPSRYYEGLAPDEITVIVEVLRFAHGDHLDLHRHNAASSVLLVPGKSNTECRDLQFEMFSDEANRKKPFFPQRGRGYQILPKIWHSITRVGEGNFSCMLSATTPFIGSDTEWYADQ